jgi:hypothetical protein
MDTTLISGFTLARNRTDVSGTVVRRCFRRVARLKHTLEPTQANGHTSALGMDVVLEQLNVVGLSYTCGHIREKSRLSAHGVHVENRFRLEVISNHTSEPTLMNDRMSALGMDVTLHSPNLVIYTYTHERTLVKPHTDVAVVCFLRQVAD